MSHTEILFITIQNLYSTNYQTIELYTGYNDSPNSKLPSAGPDVAEIATLELVCTATHGGADNH